MSDTIATYLHSRAEFYETLLPRIPHAGLRQLLQAVVRMEILEAEVAELRSGIPPEWESDSFVHVLSLRDILKKQGFGRILGQTTISFTEALSRAEMVEETGLLLFSRLSALLPTPPSPFQSAATRHQTALSEILRLSDALRYHRLPV